MPFDPGWGCDSLYFVSFFGWGLIFSRFLLTQALRAFFLFYAGGGGRVSPFGDQLVDGVSLTGETLLIFGHDVSLVHGAVMEIEGVLDHLPAGGGY